MNDLYGFIITRHVNSEKTNHYWNHSVKLLRTFYPFTKIVIIDDNSNYNFVKTEFEYKNIEIIQSEFPKRGELLPYYYFLKYKFFKNAIIIHDSIFFHKRIPFEKLNGINVLPLWYFGPDKENVENTRRIIRSLKNHYMLNHKLTNDHILGMPNDKWFGCFGVQSYINLHFLEKIEYKYGITKLITSVHNRPDRCCLERIFGCIFFTEYPRIIKLKSLLGDIMIYQKWGLSYEKYKSDLIKGVIPKPIVKVWTGR
jgi:hypothetical protein